MAPIIEAAIILLALAGNVVEAKPLRTPGRHAPPGVANVLASSKRSLHNLLARYYGTAHGLSKPPSLPTKRDTSLPDGWSTFGCVAESYDERLLQGFAFSSSSLTPLLCVTQCTKLGYTMAGTEYGDECYCGDNFNGNGGGMAPSSICNMPCEGDTSEMCGNSWYLNLYMYNSSALPLCGGSTSTVSAPAEETSSLLSTYYSSFESSVTATSSLASASSTDAAISANSSTSVMSASATTTVSSGAIEATGFETNSVSGDTSLAPTTSSAGTSTSTSPVHEDSDDSSEWNALGCGLDSEDRILSSYFISLDNMTVDSCLTICENRGYVFAGLQFSDECYCGNSLLQSTSYDSTRCDMSCAGDSEDTCGGTWAIELFELISSPSSTCTDSLSTETATTVLATSTTSGFNTASTTAIASSTNSASSSVIVTSKYTSETVSSGQATEATTVTESTTGSETANVSVTSESVIAPTSTTSTESTASAIPTSVPSSSSTHQVWAHYMVGNTYPYTASNWASDISAALAAGIDGFALNIGSDNWQPARVADAYSAAASTGFKMFLSLDMTVLSCSSSSDAANLVSIVQKYANAAAQATYEGKVLVSTFAGSDCAFSWQSDFVDVLSSAGIDIFFIPSIFSDVSTFSSNIWMDGELNWNSGWPMGAEDITVASDETYMTALGDKVYMPAVSPFFYTHFGANSWNKNWLYRSDDWLYCTRWEQLIAMRESVKMTEILTWNDYGESSYIGPIQGALPAGSETFVDGFTHTGLYSLTNYYATAFKTGAYPMITEDEIIMWARPHPHDATASSDPIGRPTGWSYTDDYLYAVVLTTGSATVTLTSGSITETFSVSAGLTKLKVSLSEGSISGSISRSGRTVASYNAGSAFTYTTSPITYNFNYFVGSSSS
ncbi:glucan endo-1,3-alpha-glucosidase agn1 [Cryptococcus neoformans c45]|nr:glucan endo-1,3-alpha-glucosidase agn1 [Cryptococcus neoformans var. grubii c45]